MLIDALTITFKDLRLLVRDRRALVILIALPMVIIAIVGSSTGRLRSDREQKRLGLTVEIINFDQTETAKRLSGFLAGYENVVVKQLNASPDTDDFDKLKSERPSGQVDARIVIGTGFEQTLMQLSRTELTAPETGPLKNGLTAINLHVTRNAMADPLTEGLVKALLRLSLQEAILPILAEKIPVFRGAAKDSVIPVPWSESESARKEAASDVRVYQFLVPSYTVLFVFFLVNIMGRSFIAERDMGTLRRLRISPISPSSILIGKTLPFYVMSLVQTSILMVSGRLLFGMSWGPQPLFLIPIMMCTSGAATTLGLLFSTLCRTESQVSSFGNLIVLSSAGISGCLVPRAWMPELSQKISLCTPHAWALDAYSELLTKDQPDGTLIMRCCGVLLLFSSTFFIAGLLRFRNQS
ncbi:MAG: ABC transporter permease [Planctomyces sp.]|nr:ABC transporter permease [Planctomyces sp.]